MRSLSRLFNFVSQIGEQEILKNRSIIVKHSTSKRAVIVSHSGVDLNYSERVN